VNCPACGRRTATRVGAPIAHEDHAQRACDAALHLRDALRRYADELRRTAGLSFSVRIGLNSGDVVVGKIGDDLRMDYTAPGAYRGAGAAYGGARRRGQCLSDGAHGPPGPGLLRAARSRRL